MTALAAVHANLTVLAAPIITPGPPPGSDKWLMVAGWVLFGIGMALVLAFAVGLARVAWANHHSSAGPSAMQLGIVALCGAIFGSLGAVMSGLF